uniref:Cytotoxic T-lymphocyte protein 4-like n=1 Tax=Xiphophorus maculatus TaxID=8083 RepID=A0A3B5R4X9_XIPMA
MCLELIWRIFVSLVIKSSCAEYLQVKLDSYSCSPVTTQNVVTSFRFYLFFVPAVKVTQPYRVVSTNGTAQIHCIIHSRTAASHLRPGQRLENLFSNQEDLQVALLRGLHGNQKICTSTLNTSEHEKEMQQEKDGDVRLLIEGAVIQVLTVFYPPPYQQLTGNGTLLHVLGRSPQSHLVSLWLGISLCSMKISTNTEPCSLFYYCTFCCEMCLFCFAGVQM